MSHDDSMTLGLSYQLNFRAIRTTLDLSMTINPHAEFNE